jgi:16S rRNA (uracil1498-N3)-methyltransferase
MSTHRFFVPPEAFVAGTPRLSGREAHHAVDVLRLRRNDPVVVLDGAGSEYACEVQEATHQCVVLSVREKRTHPRPKCEITLVQALPKGKVIESIVQKATELGALRIQPVLSERVVARMDTAEAQAKAQKWRLVAAEAVKQCGLPWLPDIAAPVPLAALLARRENAELSLVGSLQPGSRHPRTCFEEFQSREGRFPRSVWVWVGPEGDFTLEELEAVQSSGACPVSLGPLVLRSETAAIYCLSLVNYEIQWSARRPSDAV